MNWSRAGALDLKGVRRDHFIVGRILGEDFVYWELTPSECTNFSEKLRRHFLLPTFGYTCVANALNFLDEGAWCAAL